jgi:spore coat protein U-like protein
MKAVLRNVTLLALLAAVAGCLVDPVSAAPKGTASKLVDPLDRTSSCSVSNVSGIAFTVPYDPTQDVNDDANGGFTVSCSGGRGNTTIQMMLSAGDAGKCYPTRYMDGPAGATLNYNAFMGPAYRNIWGDGACGEKSQQHIIPKNGHVDFIIYGRIPRGQRNARPGQYGDSLTLTLVP